MFTPTSETPIWGPTQRILFRFLFVYLVLTIVPFPLDKIPFVEEFVEPYDDFWQVVATWVGRQVFDVEVIIQLTGSGDTIYRYVLAFCFLTLAAAATVVWTLLDRRRLSYPRLHECLRMYVRFYLGFTLITYGSMKVFAMQFPRLTLVRLVQSFGDASPMGLLWTFMGASDPYQVFAGAGELLAGLLLTARRTTLFGALVAIGVLGHVVMLNFSYDVPVKLFSSHLLAMAVFLTAPDLGRLANLLVLHRPTEPRAYRPLFTRNWLNVTALALRTAAVLAFTGWWLYRSYEARQFYAAPKSELYGIWNVEEFEVDGSARPALITDATRWRRVIHDFKFLLAVQLMSDSMQRYDLKIDADQNTLTLTKRKDPNWRSTLSHTRPNEGIMILEGTFDGQKIRAKLRRAEEREFPLVNRGFHWVQELPLNR